MHPILRIDELQRLIFASVDRRGLFGLALTCKAFFHNAIDELWKTISSLAPLLSCLPLNYQYQYRKLKLEDLKRLEFYLPKIQNVVMESKGKTLTAPAVRPKRKTKETKWNKTWDELWDEIASLRSISELWSNVRILRVVNAHDKILLPLIGMTGTNLTQLQLRFIHKTPDERVVSKLLGGIQQTPALKSLSVKDTDPHLTTLIKQSPIKYMRFESTPDWPWKPPPHDRYSFQELLRKAAMVNLNMTLQPSWYWPGIDGLQRKYFPALQVLWLDLSNFKNHNEGISPVTFLKGLESPELKDLNIKFPLEVTGRMFLEVVTAISNSCRLQDLTSLALAGEALGKALGYHRDYRPAPQTRPVDLRAGLSMLLPLPKLKVLRLSIAPNFLDVLDLRQYRSFAAQIPALQTLVLGHEEFRAQGEYSPAVYHERVPIHHLAAFCSMFPKIKEVSMGTVDASILEGRPRKEWACPRVESLTISHYAGIPHNGGVDREQVVKLLRSSMGTYFPKSNLVQNKILYRQQLRNLPRT